MNNVTLAEIIRTSDIERKFDHLKIDCRAKDQYYQTESFSQRLSNAMKSVKQNLEKYH